LVIDDLRRAYLDWLAAQNYDSGEKADGVQGWLAQQPEMRVRRAPGFTCVGSLRAGGRGTIEQAINNSKGCGGAMRVAPLGLLPHILRPEEVFELAARTAALTHGHPSGYLSAGMVAAIVRFLADGSALTIATQKACEMLTQWKDHEETSKAVAKALDLAQRNFADHLTAVRIIGEGWTGEEALAIALFAALSGRCYVEVVRIAANHDGDSDSTASIAGQLWGAWKGIDEIPHEWITRLDVLAPLLHLGRQAMEKTAPRA
jgi:ADP-ribosylglycohydrolase